MPRQQGEATRPAEGPGRVHEESRWRRDAHAVIIGIDAFQDPRIPDLLAPAATPRPSMACSPIRRWAALSRQRHAAPRRRRYGTKDPIGARHQTMTAGNRGVMHSSGPGSSPRGPTGQVGLGPASREFVLVEARLATPRAQRVYFKKTTALLQLYNRRQCAATLPVCRPLYSIEVTDRNA